MKRTEIATLLARTTPLQEVRVKGWIRLKRSSKKVTFLAVNDGSCQTHLQVVVESSLENYDQVKKLGMGAAIEIDGALVESPAAGQKWELSAGKIRVIGSSSPDFPLQKKYQSFEYLRTIAHLRPRTNTFSAVFRIRSVASYAIHDFFFKNGFVYVHTPIITGSNCEGAGDMFRVTTLDLTDLPRTESEAIDFSKDFFNRETNLTVSGQLEAETYAMGFGKVYTFGPTFRAENSNTSRHAAEFWMIEPEMAFHDLHDTIEVAGDFMQYVTRFVLEHCRHELAFLNKRVDKGLIERLEQLVKSDFTVMTYSEAITHLEKANRRFDFPHHWGADLQSEHERYLTEEVVKGPLFLIDYPMEIKAFYMRLNDDQKTVAGMDMLIPGIGEIIGGSQREERLDVLKKRIAQHHLVEQDYWWYIDLRRFGSVPHSGFGLGFERALMYLTGMSNIRDVIPFPRTPGNAEF